MVFVSRGYEIFENVSNISQLLEEQKEVYGEEIDFYLLAYETFYSKHNENQFKYVHNNNVFNKNSNYIANIDIKQVYKIEICRKKDKEKIPFSFQLIEQQDTLLRASLECRGGIAYYEGMKFDIYQELYKTMILEGYFIGIREYNKLSSQIDLFVRNIKENNPIYRVFLDIGSGVANLEGKSEELKIYHTMQDINFNHQKSEGFIPKVSIKVVRKGDLLFDYIKPTKGHIGRDLKGNILPIAPVSIHDIQVDSSIVALEGISNIKFHARKDGFLKEIRPYSFIVDDELDAKKREVDNSIKVLNIDGLTHSDSKIQADVAYIGSHRGNIQAQKVVIDVLERGAVEAKVAYINSSLGGKIIADYVYIKNLHSYNEIYFRKCLVVDNVAGEHNIFECNPARIAFAKKDRVEYMMLEKQLQTKIKHLRKRMDEIYTYLLISQGKVHKILQDNSIEQLPKNLRSVVEQYEKSLNTYQKLLLEYSDIVNLNYANKTRLKSIDEMALGARIIIRGNFPNGESLIRFNLYEGNSVQKTLKATLNQQNLYRLFEVASKDGRFRVANSSEYNPKYCDWISEFFPRENEKNSF